MASLVANITAAIQQIGADIKTVTSNLNLRGLPAGGTTGQVPRKSSNADYAIEWYTPPAAGALIDDAGAVATDKVWSSSKTNSTITNAVNQAKNDLLGGVGTAYDTLKELADALGNDQSAVTGLTTAVSLRVSVDSVQSFTSAQKAQARSNIDVYSTTDIGDPTTNFLTIYNTAKS